MYTKICINIVARSMEKSYPPGLGEYKKKKKNAAERKYFGCARFPTDETGDVLFKPAEGRRNWRERGGNAENNTRRCVSRMEASHPTRDVSITRVINARASHRCTRSLEIGLFNGKACNDPRGGKGEGE